jgi:hypothetical protein
MDPAYGGNPRADVGTMWLKRLTLLMASLFIAFCCWFVWRISMVAYQAEAAIVAISADVKQMSSTGAQISEHLQKLDNRLQAIEAKAFDAMNIDEVESMINEIDELRDGQRPPGTQLSLDAEREIKHLLSQVMQSKHRFIYSDENKGGTRFYFQLYAKYKTYKSSLSSAEDFIDKVATSSIGGHPYQVGVSPDQTVTLNDWLGEELKKYRADSGQAVQANQP